MLDREFEESLAYWIFTAGFAIETALNEELAPLGITHRQVQILGALAVHGQAAQNELAEVMRVEPSSVVRLLDRMERSGWITRESDPVDRRKKIVRPTDKARPVWQEIKARGTRAKERGLQGVTEEQIATTRHVLRTIRQNLTGDSEFPCPLVCRSENQAAGG